jgi:hypothetical protein
VIPGPPDDAHGDHVATEISMVTVNVRRAQRVASGIREVGGNAEGSATSDPLCRHAHLGTTGERHATTMIG